MFRSKPKLRLPLKMALRAYWPWLGGIVIAAALIFLVPPVSSNDTAVLVVFSAGVLPAMWPCLVKDAPYTFWIVACVLWFCLGLLLPVLKAMF
jgi:hypothetical protein